MKLILTLFIAVFSFAANAQYDYGVIRGLVKDLETGDPIPFAKVILMDDSSITVTGAMTDFDGNYELNGVKPGKYKVKIEYVAYASKVIYNVLVEPGSATNLNHNLIVGEICCDLPIATYRPPLIRIDPFGTSMTFTREDIRRSPYKP